MKKLRTPYCLRAFGFYWPTISPTSSGQVNICNKLCSCMSYLPTLQLILPESKRHTVTFGALHKSAPRLTASVLTLTQSAGLDRSRVSIRSQEDYYRIRWGVPTDTHSRMATPVHTRAQKLDNCLLLDIPLKKCPRWIDRSPGVCILNHTIPNIHSNFSKDLSSADPDK